MNPLRWKHEHQLAWALTGLVGATFGLLYGLHHFDEDKWTFILGLLWSPSSDPTMPIGILIWPGVIAGAGIAIIGFYIVKLMRA